MDDVPTINPLDIRARPEDHLDQEDDGPGEDPSGDSPTMHSFPTSQPEPMAVQLSSSPTNLETGVGFSDGTDFSRRTFVPSMNQITSL